MLYIIISNKIITFSTCARAERERDRQTDRQRETERQRGRERQRQRETERHRQDDRDRQAETDTERQRQTETEIETERQRQRGQTANAMRTNFSTYRKVITLCFDKRMAQTNSKHRVTTSFLRQGGTEKRGWECVARH